MEWPAHLPIVGGGGVIVSEYKCMSISMSYEICFPLSVKLSTGF